LMGMLLGGGTAFAREQLADGVILPSEFQQKLGIKLLGSTPKLSLSQVAEQLAQQRSAISEAYFSILTTIQFAGVDKAPKTILFTSTQGSEGKSTTALAIARSMAMVGSKVLLIDGDMRNPSVHRLVSKPMTAGLGELLVGKAQIAETFHHVGTTGLAVMFAGRMPLNPAELLSTDALDEVLEAAGEHFDHIIVDGPPVIGLADSVLLARACEATIFVIEAGRTRASQARMALGRLRTVRANLFGAILTKLDAKEQGYGDSYGYSYNYGKPAPKRLVDFIKN